MKNWPVLKSYKGKYLRRVAMPMGGIGTGTVSLGGRGNLQDWAIMNTPGIGFTPNMMEGMRDIGPFFALFTESENIKKTICLEGPLDSEHFEASHGSRVVNHGLPRFRNCTFETAYPLGQVHLQDDDIPLEVTIKAFNPLVPGDSDKSGIPMAILKYQLKNNTDKRVTASICGTLINYIGSDGREYERDWDNKIIYTGAMDNRNEYVKEKTFSGIFMSSEGVDKKSEAWGTMGLSTDHSEKLSHRTSWASRTWGDSTLDFWDDFSEDGTIGEREGGAPFNNMGSLASKQVISPGETVEVVFYITWHFPNRKTWAPTKADLRRGSSNNKDNIIGNYYTTKYANARDVVVKTLPELKNLEENTIKFVSAFCASDLPTAVKEAALFNISTLRTQTCFRTPDGYFYGWEGIHDRQGSCAGSCTHVWNYEQATAYLFGDLAKKMREVEFLFASDEAGHMNFRVELPLSKNKDKRTFAAADGQMGCIMKSYREWQLSGDFEFLKKLWPSIKKSLEFCWLEGGWDANMDGVMEGCQHNTMDVEYYGPNPQMQGWYLGALRAAEEMAEAVGEDQFAQKCRDLFLKGSRFMDDKLFNGEYYEHIISVPEKIHSKLTSNMGSDTLEDPILQLGSGCLVDQLVGQYMSHVLGLGYLVKVENVKKTLSSIMKYNYKEGFYNHFNQMRTYVVNDESALLMASYPHGNRPDEPFPYYNEVMTGFEHSTAAHMLYEDKIDEGLKVIQAIRDRYDGFKRNPFDEAECGHHYARAMASWAELLALTGFHYSAVSKEMTLAAQNGQFFWSNGSAWGTCTLSKGGNKWTVELHVLFGVINIKNFILTDMGSYGVNQDGIDQNNLITFTI